MGKKCLFVCIVIGIFFVFGTVLYSWSFENGQTLNVLGVSDDKIIIGSSSATGGHASFLGTQTVRGSLVYINEVNEKGGIHGRQIRLISYDDKYDPMRTVENTERLIGRDQVFALFDYVGTPTSVEIIDIVDRARIPLLGLFTGAETLRVPLRPYIFNVRDSYYSEAEGAVAYFVDELGLDKIAIFYQNDAFGETVLKGTELALERRGLEAVALATYVRGTIDVEDAVRVVGESGADVVVMVGTYVPLAKFVKVSNDEGFFPYFHTVSFVGSEAFAEQLIEVQHIDSEQYEKIIVTQVVPSPYSDEFEAVKEYRKLMEKYYPWDEINYVGLEGFVNAKILVEGLGRVGRNLTREKFVTALESMGDVDIGIGKNISYGVGDHQGLEEIYYSRLSKRGIFEIFYFYGIGTLIIDNIVELGA